MKQWEFPWRSKQRQSKRNNVRPVYRNNIFCSLLWEELILERKELETWKGQAFLARDPIEISLFSLNFQRIEVIFSHSSLIKNFIDVIISRNAGTNSLVINDRLKFLRNCHYHELLITVQNNEPHFKLIQLNAFW